MKNPSRIGMAVADARKRLTGGERMHEPVIERKLAQELDQYKGRWVAVFQENVVAAGNSLADVIQEALKKGITDPTVFRVPAHPERLNLL